MRIKQYKKQKTKKKGKRKRKVYLALGNGNANVSVGDINASSSQLCPNSSDHSTKCIWAPTTVNLL